MKYIFILLLTGCASIQPIQVNRTWFTLVRFETRYRFGEPETQAIWSDRRGIEYVENIADSTSYRIGMVAENLIRK